MAEVNQSLLYATVYETVREIPSGKVATYGQIAKLIGLPRHARHVGIALSHLDGDSTVPWHRVVNARGRICVKHAGKIALQQGLLENEGIHFTDRGNILLKKFQWCP
ncbi:MAG: MGMT family protein [Ostreibacterium sp.]